MEEIAVEQGVPHGSGPALASGRPESAETMREGLLRLATAFERAPVGLAHLLPDGRIQRLNAAAAALLPCPAGAALGQPLQRFVHPDDQLALVERLLALVAGTVEVLEAEVRLLDPVGGARWVRCAATLVREAHEGRAGAPFYCVVVLDALAAGRVAVVARAREEAQREVEGLVARARDAFDQRLRLALDTMIDCVGVYRAVRDAAGRITDFRVEYVNDAACANNRMPREAQLGRGLCELLPAHRASGLFDAYVRVVESRTPFEREQCVYGDVYGDGQALERAFDIRAVPLDDGFVAAWRDVTPRVQAALELRALVAAHGRAERLHAFTAALAVAEDPEAVYDVLLAHGRAAVGASAAAVVRPAADDPTTFEVVGAVGYDVPEFAVWARFPDTAPAPMAEACRLGEPVWVATAAEARARYPAVASLLASTGYEGWLAIPFVLGEHDSRRVLGGLGVAFAEPYAVDEAGRAFLLALGRQAAQALERTRVTALLRASEARARALVADLPGGAAFVIDPDLRYRLAGGEALRSAGFAPEHFVGRRVDEALDPELAAYYTPYFQKALAGESFTHEHEAHGHVYLSRGLPLRGAAGAVTGALAVSYDITARREAERERERLFGALAAERALLGAVLDQMPVGVVLAEAPSGAILFANTAATRALGHPVIYASAPSEYGAYGAEHPDGRPYAPAEYPLVQALAGATVDQHLTRYRRGDGTLTHFAVSAAPVYDADGRLVRAVCAWTDVHERVALEAALRQARDVADAANRAKSDFLASMSHELRTPLNAIQGHVQLLAMELHGPVTGAQREALGRVTRAQHHLLGLIDDVLDYAKLEAGRVEYRVEALDLGEVLGDAGAIMESQMAAHRLAFAVRPPTEACAVWADGDKLRQVLLNLLSNAAKFTPADGHVEVTAEAPADAPTLVRVRVRDTGIGIPADKQAAVFEPFVQVSAGHTRVQQGTGLGLAISRDLARGMGGELTLESAPGAGATFTLTLRRVQGADGRAVDRRAADEARRGAADRQEADGHEADRHEADRHEADRHEAVPHERDAPS